MARLQVFVCTNFAPEFLQVHEVLEFDDIEMQVFAAPCVDRRQQASMRARLEEGNAAGDEVVLIAGTFCEAARVVESWENFRVITAENCHNHLVPESLDQFITQRGGYIVGSGWLQNWGKNLQDLGFDMETARDFYRDSCQELVFFDTGVVADAEALLAELSRYVERPYTVIPWELTGLLYLLKSVAYEWRIRQAEATHQAELYEAQMQCAEYASIMDFMGRIAANVTRRDTIDRIKELFQMVLGAHDFTYWSADAVYEDMPDDVEALLRDSQTTHALRQEDNRFYLKVNHQDTVFGVIEVGDFLFPQYIERYLNFALSIAPVCGLTLANIAHYDTLRRTQEELRYLSYHDALTDLFNRAYLLEVVSQGRRLTHPCVFSFDLNGLKQVNDTYGHAEGDQLIQSAGRLLRSRFRETDVVARIGGDEFVAIVEDCGPALAKRRLQEIQAAVETFNQKEAPTHRQLGIAVGYASSAGRDMSLEDLMREADAAMYADKARQRH